ncbi:MAG: alkaline phosphatase family protein [Candidatus Gracilibacteria bacterium]|nr:alkaline phosphatase family protein [Candidatus Gracilibacteria bacterium]MDD2908761.1 alkaline phosphatase family protein [Candidatus Gracilibacteria bacterium]
MIKLISDKKELLKEYEDMKIYSMIKGLDGAYSSIYDKSIKEIHDFVLKLYSGKKQIFIFAIDSISFKYFSEELIDILPEKSQKSVLTSVFPSTTSCAWISIMSGLSTSQHGIVGVSFFHELYNKSFIWLNDEICSTDLKKIPIPSRDGLFRTDFDNIFQKVSGKHTYYGRHGMGKKGGYTIIHEKLTKGTKHSLPNISAENYLDLKMIFEGFKKYISDESILDKSGLHWLYLDLDFYIHKYGYTKELKEDFFIPFFKLLNSIKNDDNEIIFCSDHGQIQQGKVDENIFERSKGNNDLKIMTSGAGRSLFFYPKDGKEKRVLKWVKELVKDTGWVFDKNKWIELGLIDANEKDNERIGEIIAIAKGDGFPSTGPSSLFEHGGISEEEMFVPFVLF